MIGGQAWCEHMPYDDVTRAGEVRRIEVFTGSGPRRRWSPDEKARIIAESYAGVDTVCDVARRHGLAPTQLFTWRRGARLPREARSAPAFAPVVIQAPALPVLASPRVEPRPSALLDGMDWARVYNACRTRVPIAAN